MLTGGRCLFLSCRTAGVEQSCAYLSSVTVGVDVVCLCVLRQTQPMIN